MDVIFPQMVGNRTLCRRLAAELRCGSFSHAYIIEGPSGSGKHTLAREIAMAAACLAKGEAGAAFPCGECKFCRKIKTGRSPDVITVCRKEGNTTMGVDVVRELRSGIATVPNDLDVKVYVIEDAHTMTTQAQNALLLTLEEPPPFVLFLLLSEDADALLETVRSRAPILRMQPVEREEMRRFLLSDERAIAMGAAALARDNPEELEALLTVADGRLGVALALLDAQKRAPLIAQRENAARFVSLLGELNATAALMELLLSLGSNRADLTSQLSLFEEALRDMLVLGKSATAPLLFYTDREAAAEIAAGLGAGRLFRALEAIAEAKKALAINANVKLTVTRLLTRLTQK